jgi:hypothetical protein
MQGRAQSKNTTDSPGLDDPIEKTKGPVETHLGSKGLSLLDQLLDGRFTSLILPLFFSAVLIAAIQRSLFEKRPSA